MSIPNDPGLSRIGQIAVTVHDLDRATAFYRDTLGMKLLFAVPNLAFFDAGGIRLMLGRPENAEQDHPGSILYFDVPDVRDAYQALKARGVQFVDEPHVVAPMPKGDLWMTFFKDLDHNTLAIMSELPRG
ncbi:MAG: VOC family protein [Gemmatimonadaceae bacterium]|nr:VOC family protein [Gemmatimonadaceae bacterium]